MTPHRLSYKNREHNLIVVAKLAARILKGTRSAHQSPPACPQSSTRFVSTRLLALTTLLIPMLSPFGFKDALAVETPVLDPSRVSWTQARFKASKLFVSTKTTVDLKKISGSEVASTLIASGKPQDLNLSGSEGLYMKLHAKYWGRNVVTRSWIEPNNAQALQRLTTESEERQRYKLYLTDSGVFRVRKKPRDGNEQNLSAERWTDVSERFHEYPAGGGNRPVVTLPIGIFYVLATAELNAPGDKIEVPVFSTKYFNLVTITVEGTTRIRADYKETSASGRRNKVNGQVDALRVSLKPRVMGTGEIDFYFLGLKGDVDVVLDKKHRVPLRLNGEVEKVGDLEINLDRLELN